MKSTTESKCDDADIFSDLSDVLRASEPHILPQNRDRFDFQVTSILKDFVRSLSDHVKENTNGGWTTLQQEWFRLRRMIDLSEGVIRRKLLLQPSNEDEFKANLWWIAECGEEQDLVLLKRIKEDRLYQSEEVDKLLNIASDRIVKRKDDWYCVACKGEEAYHSNKAEWDEKYRGQFIAIHHGKVLAADEDRERLSNTVLEAQKEKGEFRAYIVKVGSGLIDVLGPRVRLSRSSKS